MNIDEFFSILSLFIKLYIIIKILKYYIALKRVSSISLV